MTTKQRLASGAAILRSIDTRRQRTGNRNELLALEQAIVDRELIELEHASCVMKSVNSPGRSR